MYGSTRGWIESAGSIFSFSKVNARFGLRGADPDHLVYLHRGDAALTWRAEKYSALSAVVVRFSRSRGRYRRQTLFSGRLRLSGLKKNTLRMPNSGLRGATGPGAPC